MNIIEVYVMVFGAYIVFQWAKFEYQEWKDR